MWDTEDNSGVQIYVLLADRDVEIVADRGLNDHVTPAEWEEICRRMELKFRAGEFEAGSLAAVSAVSGLLGERLPVPRVGYNELSDRPAVL